MKWLVGLILVLGATTSFAQVANMGGDMVPNSPGIIIQGPITPGDCTMWINANTIGDAGAPCGTGGGGCTSQLILNYSIPCTLIAQGWGQ